MLEVRCEGVAKLRNQRSQEMMRTPLEACPAGGVRAGHSQGPAGVRSCGAWDPGRSAWSWDLQLAMVGLF